MGPNMVRIIKLIQCRVTVYKYDEFDSFNKFVAIVP